MFAYVDKQLHGTEQGVLLKAEAHAAIENYFQVGRHSMACMRRREHGICWALPSSNQ